MNERLFIWREWEGEQVCERSRTRLSWNMVITRIEHVTNTLYSRVKHQSRILFTRRERVLLASENDRWYVQASVRLDSARAIVNASMSLGSVKMGFAVRTYVRMRVWGSSARAKASSTFDV